MLNSTLAEEWESFRTIVLYKESEKSLGFLKTIFYSGAYAMSTLFISSAGQCEDEAEGAAILKTLDNECISHFKLLKGFSESDGGDND